MEITTKELRIQPGKIIDQVANGEEITVTFRGKPLARIVPIVGDSSSEKEEVEGIFGMWKNRTESESVETIIRTMREGRKF